MEEPHKEKYQKKQLSKVSIVALVLIATFSVMIIVRMIPANAQPVYCHFELEELNESNLPRKECVNIAVVSEDIGAVNFETLNDFDALNVQCYDSVDDLTWCDNSEMGYFNVSLSWFCDNCTVDGLVCLTYSANFYDSEDVYLEEKRELYRQMYLQHTAENYYDLKQTLINCGGSNG